MASNNNTWVATGGQLWDGHQFPLEIRRCQRDSRGIVRRTADAGSLMRLECVALSEISETGVVAHLRHSSGDPFLAAFDGDDALEITDDECHRLRSLDESRGAISHSDYLRDVAAVARARAEMIDDGRYASLSPDEKRSLDRCARP